MARDEKINFIVHFEEIDYTNTEMESLLEILGLIGYFDNNGRWIDAKR